MKEIYHKNGIVLVDDEDFERLEGINVCVSRCGGACLYDPKTKRTHQLGRFLVGVTDPALEVDHRDRNRLNNQRSNLRVCTSSQNSANRTKPRYYAGRTQISKYKGVNKNSRGEWVAKIQFQYSVHNLGTFSTERAAARAYNEKAKELHGEFALLNIIPQTA